MSRYLPLFPLNIVVFPGETLNLHIFEPRYKQLINECWKEGSTFGIASVSDQKLSHLGTEIMITEVEREYEGGEMDIRTRGLRAFRIHDFFKQVKDKLYGGGTIEELNDYDEEDKVIKIKLIDHLNELYRIIQPYPEKVFDESLTAFSIAHKVGLSTRQELELLAIEHETERQVYLLNHLKHIIPILEQVENLKERIRLNGHFKKLSLRDF